MKKTSSKTSWKGYYGNSSATNLSTFSTQAQDRYDEKVKKKNANFQVAVYRDDGWQLVCVWSHHAEKLDIYNG